MKDETKTKEQLLCEVRELRGRIAQLEAVQVGQDSAEERPQNALRFLQTVLDTIPTPIFYKNAQGVYLGCNKAFEAYLGVCRSDIVGKTVYDVAPKDLADKYYEMDQTLFRQSGVQTYESSVVYADGSRHDVIFNKATFPDAEGRVAGLVGVMLDITRRKQTEDALRRSEQQFRMLIETMSDGVGVQNAENTFVYANDKLCEMLGYSCDEIIGRSMRDFLHLLDEADRKTLKKEMDRRRKGEQGFYEVSWTRKDGRRYSGIISAVPILDPDGRFQGAFSVITDITERKQSEEALRQSEERFRSIFEKAGAGILMMDRRTGKYTKVNPAFQQISGYTEQELLTMGPSDIVHPDDRAAESVLLEELCSGKRDRYQIEKRYLLKSGEIIWGRVTVSLIHDASGDSKYVLSVIEDITGRKKAEEAVEIYTARLEQSNRDLQDFASVASHDLQEPLRKIHSFSERLRLKHGDCFDEMGRDYLNRMQDATRRMQDLIQALLRYSRVATQGEPFTLVDLPQVVTKVLEDLETRIEQTGGRVEVGELPVIEADPNQMRQLFQNLIGNALKFLGEKGSTVKVYSHPLEAPHIKESPFGGKWYRIFVEDDGIGFDEKYLDRIFAPFQRLHGRSSAFEGTGMGLAICRRIVERHRGSITARSTPGKGSTFIITLPVEQPEGEALEGKAGIDSSQKEPGN